MRLLLLILFAGLAQVAAAQPHALIDLQRLDADSPLAPISSLRAQLPDNPTIKLSAMRDAALATGAQHGYSSRMDELKVEIRSQSESLDRIYDFGTLMRIASKGDSELYLLPPVIQAAKDVSAVDASQRRIRVSGQLFAIIEPARLVTRPPNWREYLVFDDPRPLSLPDKVLLPDTNEERRYWAAWIAEGWKAGVIQADQEMASRVRRLANTYTGMVRYVRMNLEQKVDAPTVVALERPVSGNDNEMRIDDRVYELSRDAKMNTDPKRWRAIPTDPRDSLLTPDEAKDIKLRDKERREKGDDDGLTVFSPKREG